MRLIIYYMQPDYNNIEMHMKRTRNRTYPEVTVDITSLSHEGRGITNIQGKTTFIHGAIADEKVVCKITKYHRRYNEGKIIQVLEASPRRIEPACIHFGTCGGCSMQHIDVIHQVQLKQQTLLEQLKHFGSVEPEMVLPPISGTPWGYRGKARLGVRYVIKKEKLLVGFRENFSNYLADIESCPVLNPAVGTRLKELSAMIASLSQYDQIAQVEVAAGETTIALVIRHMTALPDEDLQKIRAFAEQYAFHIYLQPNPPAPITKLWPTDGNERLSYTLPDYDLEMQFYPLDFTQVNSEINRLMIKQALLLLDLQPTDQVLDLFCGLGNFTLPIARFAQHVVGVEGSQEMVRRGQENARHNTIHNTEFYAANLMEPIASDAWLQKKYDKILIDPPRTGAKEIIELLPQLTPKKIVYVSCNPATLARDAKELVHTHGYTLKKAGAINMFPHTSHIEAIALFER
jgi:23S rRNA (uracil1939-C5)-methyltransferase